MKNFWLMFIVLILASSFTYAIQPQQSTSKLFLNPFYRATTTSNNNYNYSVVVNPPDGISMVNSAIVSFDVYLTPSVTFNLTVNGGACNNPTFVVSTTFSGAGQARVTFDCSNRIRDKGNYSMVLRVTQANTGAITGWVDLTYMNNPQGDLTIHGTEYVFGQTSKSWLQLLDNNLSYINNAVCFVDIYYPDQSEFIERATMTNSNHDGIYYYDIIPPQIEGVYPVIAECFYQASQTYNNVTSFSIFNGSLDAGDYTRTFVEDNVYMSTTETTAGAGNPRRYSAEFNFTNSTCTNISQTLMQGITIGGTFRWNSNPTTDDMNIYIYNWSNASWVLLPNPVSGVGTGAKTVSNTLFFTNITNAGFVNRSANRPLRIKFEDNNITDTASSGMDYDYLYVSCNQLSSPAWQDVKGSSEIHVTNPLGYRFIPETLCNGEYPNSPDCAYFSSEGDHPPEGVIIENITLSNPLGHEITQPYIYTTASGIDCTAIDSVEIIKGNVTEDLTDTTIYSLGDSNNCVLGIPITFFADELLATVHIHMDNYIKWEVLRANDIRQGATILSDTCNQLALQYNFTYITPLNTSAQNLTNNTDLIYCSRVMDDLWYFDTVYNDSLNITTVGEYESYYYEIANFYLPLIQEEYTVISGGLRNINQLNILQLLNSTLFNNTYTINVNLTEILDYLGVINNTIVTINGRTVSIENFVNDSNNRLILLNNTVYDMYSLMLQMNQTLSYVYNFADSINATVISIQSTINGVEQVVLDINGTVTIIDANVVVINNTVSNIYTDTQAIRQDLIYMNNTINNIYNATLDIQGYSIIMDGKIDQIYNAVVVLNGTVNNIENVSLTIDGKVDVIDSEVGAIATDVNFIKDAVITINSTTTSIENKVDIIDSNVDFVKDVVVTINGTVNGINNTVFQIQGQITNIEGIVNQINNSVNIIDGKIDQLSNDIFQLNNTANTIYDAILQINNSQSQQLNNIYGGIIDINGTVNGLNNTLISMNGSIMSELSNIYSVVFEINGTQYNYTQNFDDIYSLLLNMNGTLYYVSGNVDGLTISMLELNNTLTDVQSTVNDIQTTLIDVNGTVYSIQNDVNGIEISLVDINNTVISNGNKIDNLESMLINMNGTLVYVKSSVDGITASLISMNGTLIDIQSTVNDIESVVVNINGSIYLMQQDIDGIELSLLDMNATIVDTNNVVHTIDGNVVAINNTLYFVQQTVNGIEVSLIDMNNTIISTQNIVNQINDTTLRIESATITLNNTANNIYSGMIVINGTINGMADQILVINGTINSVESKIDILDVKVDEILANLYQMNATINNIYDGVMNITIPYVNLTYLETAMGNVEGMVININNSLEYFNNSILNMTQTLNDVHTLVFSINSTTYEIRNMTVIIDQKIDSLSNFSIIINGSIYSFLSEFALIQQMIQNQTDFLVIALADISYFGNNTNASDYYENLSIPTPSILETQLFKVGIDTLQEPIEGDFYRLNYYIFNRDTGDLTKEIQTTVKGTNSFELPFSSEGLDPVNKAEQMYDIWIRVEMLNGIGFWQSFALDYVGELKVVNLNDNGPKAGLYDVIVATTYDRWDIGESVRADITIVNTGDAPDEDTILTYWLEDSGGNKYGITKEQFLEVPVGTMTIDRSIALPLASNEGQWQFKASYETVVQPMITVYETFDVSDMTWWDKVQNRLPIFIRANWMLSGILFFIFLVILIILLTNFVSDSKEKRKYKKRIEDNNDY